MTVHVRDGDARARHGDRADESAGGGASARAASASSQRGDVDARAARRRGARRARRTRRRSRITIRWRCTRPSRRGRATSSPSTTRRRASSACATPSRRRSASQPENVRVVSLLHRRRLRQQGRRVVARDARRDGGARGEAAGEARRSRGGRCSAPWADGRTRCSTSRSARRATARSPRSGTTSTSNTSTLEDWVEPATSQTRMLYACPNVETTYDLVRLNVGTPTFMRAPGESTGTFALESAMDELAYALEMDPVAAPPEELRRARSGERQAVVEQVAARVLSRRRRAVRVEQAQIRQPRSMRDGTLARRLGHGDGDVSGASPARAARRRA